MSSEARKWKAFSGNGTILDSVDRSEPPGNLQDVDHDKAMQVPETDSGGWGNGSSFGSPSHGSRGSASTGESYRQEQGSGSECSPLENLPVKLHALEDTANVDTQSLVTPPWYNTSNIERHSPDRSGLMDTNAGHSKSAPLTVQEACLLRHFIEEISPWFDHCDDRRHFQLVVPRRAQHCSIIRNALFAVSARHLARLPQYATPDGILYHGQLLPDLQGSTAVEYTLKCIPDLVRYPEMTDPLDQENIMVATVILRQYEEMEEDMDTDTDMSAQDRVNFLAITQRIIDSMISYRLEQSLATAAYWIAIRQEVYYALTRERAPNMRFGPDDWNNASVASTLIMLASEVTKWCWGDSLTDEWERLMLRHQKLRDEYRTELAPMFEKRADRLRGEIFPTIWYGSDDQVTAVQHLELAGLILTAQNPHLESSTRAAHRKAEAQVRSIVLKICGIALNHVRCHPALVNAVIAITLYGDYFTEPEERDALVGIIDQTRELHSWPMQKRYAQLKHRWQLVDSCSL
ncbi:hypothetical protein BO94DRAFT_551930 [Aspergillus sclerotioniger CBS 115572]|uniref:ARCA-like protein n=1 Tax=Aspergillus sclerotioniger CBS 115572 TaxID=1450535 RepID=A0A317XGU7_9EURO|nr:hypothetical protein BO94DRAFT_551930 [Aspergillus sclerotioniger CBS 115572]PWY96230.1 hypothetical protein BO94DRAFT_551930 [Aspergillus sclerotioniger CBS 115572]